MKLRLIIFLLLAFFGKCFSQTDFDSVKAAKINDYIEKIVNDKKIEKKSFTVYGKNRKRADYQYDLKAGKTVRISREWKSRHDNWEETNIDEFFLLNGKYIYARQSITDVDINDRKNISGWSFRMWIENGQVIYMTSLGHGKTESDDWNYKKELEDNFNFMMKTIKKHKK